MKLRELAHSVALRACVCAVLCLACAEAGAEVIVLRSGKTIQGEIMMHNEDVVVVRLRDGSRYQYPTAEVTIISKEAPSKQPERQETTSRNTSGKAVALHAEVAEGAAYVPYAGWGEYTNADLQVGTHQLAGRRIFVGGSIGFDAIVAKGSSYLFLPLQAAAHIPLTDKKHAPAVGMTLGYGFAVKGASKGGMTAGVNIGWQYNINDRTGLHLGADIRWQQAQTRISEEINGNTYTHTTGNNLLTLGVRFGVQF